MKSHKTAFAFLLSIWFLPFSAQAESSMSPELKEKAKQASDLGMHYLRDHQSENGSWSNSVGITGLALRAFLESPRKYVEADGPFITKPIKFILSHVKPDGSISETVQNVSYNTAVAITALKSTNNPAYAEIISNGQKYLKGIQLDEKKEYPKEHQYHGGIGYGGDERPDMSNEYIAIEALKSTELDPNDPVWQKALVFISRSQNNSETNDQAWAKNDGGFTYMPGYSPNGETNSYGGMTHAGLISLLFAGVEKDDPRVEAAYKWIKDNYTVEHNPGALKDQGLFYYYNAFAKSMYAYGETEFSDANGIVHNWRNDIAGKLISLQAPDGSWVNTNTRWWESDKNLVTAWSVIALNYAVKDN
jgi:squalene-hopene/tetraprenyl-beta-curcumene cyclase